MKNKERFASEEKDSPECSVVKGTTQTKSQSCPETGRSFLRHDMRTVFSSWALCKNLLRKTEARPRRDLYAKEFRLYLRSQHFFLSFLVLSR